MTENFGKQLLSECFANNIKQIASQTLTHDHLMGLPVQRLARLKDKPQQFVFFCFRPFITQFYYTKFYVQKL